MGKLYSFADHPEHKSRLGAWAQRWIANALRTEPQTEDDRDKMRIAMRGLYAAAKLEPVPEHREIFCASPMSSAIAASVASGDRKSVV